ncbi:MAG: type II toxin-antitoxin system RelE/ParE family toxin [Acidobacteria bacterium]|nr:type II toxin-antitoxin system RelE/ParE family toxin [Acidobacteriota bacterium]
MRPRIEYKASVEKDLGRLEKRTALRVLARTQKALAEEARAGEALAGELAGLYKLRVGDYRVIYARTTEGYLVLRIGHRREIYRRERPAR